jgi:hypothetical protein
MQTRHALVLVLLSALSSACGERESGVARAAERPASLCEHPVWGPLTPGTRLLLPLTSRSEVVPLAPMEGTTLTLELPGAQGGQLRLTTLRHRDDEQVLETESGLVVAGPPTLAHRVEGAEPTRLARQDSHAAAGTMTLHAPAGDWEALVVLPTHAGMLRTGQRELSVGRGARAAAVVLAPAPSTVLEASVPVDHAFYTDRVRPARLPRLGSWLQTRFERGALRVDLAGEPPLEEGETLTLVLEVVEPPRMGAVPRESAAPAPAARRAWLTDVTRTAGIEVVHLEGPDLQLDIRPTMGPGAAWGDFNGDGHPDLFLVQGAGRPEQEPLPHRLYLGDGTGSFRDATEGAGLGSGDAGMGALAFDAEGDGDLDLYLANRGRDRLLLGRGDGTFEEASALLPDLELWSAAACAADYDGDGDLDLYVTSYLEYDPSLMPPENAARRIQREDPLEMLPYLFPGQRNQLLRNDLVDGVLAFKEVAVELGVHDPKTRVIGEAEQDAPGLGMQAMWWDFDRDGDQDLYVANDVTPNVLFENQGDGTFRDVTLEAGMDDPRGGMGLTIADVDADGDEDVFLTNWELEANALYLNLLERRMTGRTRRPRIRDGAIAAGVAAAGIGVTSWGPALVDLELDGDLDLFVANGYTSPDYQSTGICVGQPDHLFLATAPGRFEQAPAALLGERSACASRGVVACDFDRDGDEDLLVTANNGAPRLLRNDSPRAGGASSLRVALRGRGANPFGIGAEVTVEAGERLLRRTLRAGEGYLTSAAPELVFGLGSVTGPLRVTVRWPSGRETVHEGIEPGGSVVLQEG